MDTGLIKELQMCNTDVEGALRRLSGDDNLYMTCLKAFLQDPTMDQLSAALTKHSWDDAFTAAHALKGLAGNMGFIPLYYAISELVVLIRSGKTDEISASLNKTVNIYNQLVTAICRNIGTAL